MEEQHRSNKPTASPTNPIRKHLLTLIKISVSVSLLTFIFSQIEVSSLLLNLRQADPFWLTTAVGLMLLGVVIRAWRWRILLIAIRVRVSLWELVAIYLIGFFFNNFALSGIGGDVMRVIELRRHSERTTDAATSILVERFLGLAALQAIGMVALLFDPQAVPLELAALTVILFTGLIGGGYLFVNRWVYTTLRDNLPPFRWLTTITIVGKLFESVQSYPATALRGAFVASILFNLSLIGMNVCLGLAVGVEATLTQYAIFIPITSAVLIIPFTIAGLGLREGAYIALFETAGVPNATAVAMSVLVYLVGNVVSGVIGGVVYLLRVFLGKS